MGLGKKSAAFVDRRCDGHRRVFSEMQEQMFDRQKVRIIRTAGKYTEKMVLTIFGAALQIWETLAGHHEIRWEGLDETVVCRAYLFRYALGIVVNLLWWIRVGSQAVVRMDRMSNDLIDLGFVVYATTDFSLVTRRPPGFMPISSQQSQAFATFIARIELLPHMLLKGRTTIDGRYRGLMARH